MAKLVGALRAPFSFYKPGHIMIKNDSHVSLPLAVWLATDFYDHSKDPNEISVTTLLKPLRELVLLVQHPQLDPDRDVSSQVSTSIGTAIHMNIEEAWKQNAKTVMKELGYPKRLIERVQLNPAKNYLDCHPDCVPVYMERRTKREIDGVVVSGKFDFVMDGRLTDFKSSMVYGWAKGNNTEKYVKQGSIYRWLNPDIIVDDIMILDYVFLDWSAGKATYEKPYPIARTPSEEHVMMSVQETEAFIRNKISMLKELMQTPGQDHLPLCTEKELWQDPSVFKYYKNPKNTNRSTKNFTTRHEADARLRADGSVGIVKEVPGMAKACVYCNAGSVCKQAVSLVAAGKLVR